MIFGTLRLLGKVFDRSAWKWQRNFYTIRQPPPINSKEKFEKIECKIKKIALSFWKNVIFPIKKMRRKKEEINWVCNLNVFPLFPLALEEKEKFSFKNEDLKVKSMPCLKTKFKPFKCRFFKGKQQKAVVRCAFPKEHLEPSVRIPQGWLNPFELRRWLLFSTKHPFGMPTKKERCDVMVKRG